MFNKEQFIKELDRFTIDNPYEISTEEIHAIMEDCMKDDDPLYLAVYEGFLCGCMKTKDHIVGLISDMNK